MAFGNPTNPTGACGLGGLPHSRKWAESIEAGRLRRPDQNQKRGAGNMFLHHSSYSTDPPESRLFCVLCKPLSNAAGNDPRKRVIRLSISYPGIGLPIPKSRFRIPSVSAKMVKKEIIANFRDLYPLKSTTFSNAIYGIDSSWKRFAGDA